MGLLRGGDARSVTEQLSTAPRGSAQQKRVGVVLGQGFHAGDADSSQLATRAHAEVQRLVHEARALVG